MSFRAQRFIRTIDTIVDAIQFLDVISAEAIVEWVDSLRGDGWHPIARYDRDHNTVFVPHLSQPGRVDLGWWVVRWPSGEFAAYPPDAFTDMFEEPSVSADLARRVAARTGTRQPAPTEHSTSR